MNEQRGMTSEDLYQLTWVNDPVPSPQGGYLVYVSRQVNENTMDIVRNSDYFIWRALRTDLSLLEKMIIPQLGRRMGHSLLLYAKCMEIPDMAHRFGWGKRSRSAI